MQLTYLGVYVTYNQISTIHIPVPATHILLYIINFCDKNFNTAWIE
jgi:hypothetical protein